ncbi:MAG TPA: YbaK/EbsC family protein [Opitutaceae bacterium]|nr:YbaK/EbsC family protein [Opitutaceae bacterium]
MVLKTLCDYLDREQIRYTVISHSPAFTAQEIAAASHISGRELAKTVVVRADGELVMAVLPASYRIDVETMSDHLGAARVEIAHESEFHNRFPGCETGAMPPFGNLYGLPVFVARELTEDEYIAFNAGSHTELVQMRYEDFDRLVRPRVLDFAALV